MKLQIAVLAVTVLALLDFGEAAVRFRSCGKSVIKNVVFEGSNNAATPDVYRGKTYTARIEYVAAAPHKTLESNWYGVFAGKDLKWDEIVVKPGCETISPGGCPIQAGKTYTYRETLVVPNATPKMRSVVRMRQVGDNGADNICIIFSLNVK